MATTLRNDLLVRDHAELRPDGNIVAERNSQFDRAAERAKSAAESWKAVAKEKAQQFQRTVHRTFERFESRVYIRCKDARIGFNRLRQERPVVIIGAAAGLGLVVGVALRFWRSNRA